MVRRQEREIIPTFSCEMWVLLFIFRWKPKWNVWLVAVMANEATSYSVSLSSASFLQLCSVLKRSNPLLKRMSFFVWLLFEESDRAVNCDLCMHALDERRGEHNEESCAWKLQSLNHPLILLISSIYCTKHCWNEDDMFVFHSKWCLKLRKQLLKTLLLLTSKLVTKFAPTCSSFYVLSKNVNFLLRILKRKGLSKNCWYIWCSLFQHWSLTCQ